MTRIAVKEWFANKVHGEVMCKYNWSLVMEYGCVNSSEDGVFIVSGGANENRYCAKKLGVDISNCTLEDCVTFRGEVTKRTDKAICLECRFRNLRRRTMDVDERLPKSVIIAEAE